MCMNQKLQWTQHYVHSLGFFVYLQVDTGRMMSNCNVGIFQFVDFIESSFLKYFVFSIPTLLKCLTFASMFVCLFHVYDSIISGWLMLPYGVGSSRIYCKRTPLKQLTSFSKESL